MTAVDTCSTSQSAYWFKFQLIYCLTGGSVKLLILVIVFLCSNSGFWFLAALHIVKFNAFPSLKTSFHLRIERRIMSESVRSESKPFSLVSVLPFLCCFSSLTFGSFDRKSVVSCCVMADDMKSISGPRLYSNRSGNLGHLNVNRKISQK